jgi:cell division protein FtsN
VAARRPNNNPRRDDPKPRSSSKGGGLITGLFIGLVIGLIVAAGLAWYFNNRTPNFESVETASSERDKADQKPASEAASKTAETPAEASVPEKPQNNPATDPGTPQDRTQTSDAAPGTTASDSAQNTAQNTAKPRVDYTFYGILPGDKPAKPVPPPISKDVWWLQVAALKNPADADKLKARLSLLGLQVAMQKVDSGGIPLYRIRTGPYQREDDALGDLDTLAANNFEPRLFKEPNTPAAAQIAKEKP